jgi:hypothetical protein
LLLFLIASEDKKKIFSNQLLKKFFIQKVFPIFRMVDGPAFGRGAEE